MKCFVHRNEMVLVLPTFEAHLQRHQESAIHLLEITHVHDMEF